MTFESQIEAVTGIAAGATGAPATNELTQFLTDGAKDVIQRVAKISPEKLLLFTIDVELSDGNGITTENGLVVNALRADGETETSLYPCQRISSELRYKATDLTSLEYRSVYNPVFYILNHKAYILPAPTDGTVNKGVINYITYPTVAYNGTAITNFPAEFEPLVVQFAIIKSFQALMGFYATTEEDIELVQTVQASLVTAEQLYDKAFNIMMPQQQPQGEE
tara:strand:+ start:468 stop:1133 length:666 start_codon:yes stop_codon:yes gene_type:complete